MDNMEHLMLQLHVWPVAALAALVVLNLVVLATQKEDRKLKKYLRIQAIAWITLMSMIVFTGAATMATLRMDFTLSIGMMIVAALALISLEVRRHLVLKKARCDRECFARARKKMLRYYIFELLWILLIGAFAPCLS